MQIKIKMEGHMRLTLWVMAIGLIPLFAPDLFSAEKIEMPYTDSAETLTLGSANPDVVTTSLSTTFTIPCGNDGSIVIDFKTGNVKFNNCPVDKQSKAFYEGLREYFEPFCASR